MLRISVNEERADMKTLSLVAGVLMLPALLAGAGCVSSRAQLADSADRLELNADLMAQNARYQPPDAEYPPSYGRAALTLAGDAQQLSAAAAEPAAADGDVRAASVRVSQDYAAVRDAVEQSGSAVARSDLKSVSAAYHELQSELAQPHAERAGSAQTAALYP
jgi:hypothetical protein